MRIIIEWRNDTSPLLYDKEIAKNNIFFYIVFSSFHFPHVFPDYFHLIFPFSHISHFSHFSLFTKSSGAVWPSSPGVPESLCRPLWSRCPFMVNL